MAACVAISRQSSAGCSRRGLHAGVDVNSAWCDINMVEVENILAEVRSRLLDFTLSGIVGVPVTSVKQQALICFWHEFDHASASSVTTTPESMPKFQISIRSHMLGGATPLRQLSLIPGDSVGISKSTIAKNFALGSARASADQRHPPPHF